MKKIKIYLRKSGDLNYELITPYGEVCIENRDKKFRAWGWYTDKVCKVFSHELNKGSEHSVFKYKELKIEEESLKKLMNTLKKDSKLENDARKLSEEARGLASLVGNQVISSHNAIKLKKK